MSNIPITAGSGTASVATETVSGQNYQRIEVIGLGGASVLAVNADGSLNATLIGTPNVNVAGSIITVAQSSVAVAIVSGSIAATFTPPANQSVSGTVQTDVRGSVATVIIGGSIAATFTPPANQSVSGAVSVSNFPTTQNVSGSVVAFINGTLPVTNVGSILAYQAPLASIVQGTADLRVVQGASVAVLASPGSGIRNYVKHVQIANYGSASVLVTIADNTTSILGYTIAPAGGGSNYDCDYRAAANSPVTASINGVASVLVSMQGFTA